MKDGCWCHKFSCGRRHKLQNHSFWVKIIEINWGGKGEKCRKTDLFRSTFSSPSRPGDTTWQVRRHGINICDVTTAKYPLAGQKNLSKFPCALYRPVKAVLMTSISASYLPYKDSADLQTCLQHECRWLLCPKGRNTYSYTDSPNGWEKEFDICIPTFNKLPSGKAIMPLFLGSDL